MEEMLSKTNKQIAEFAANVAIGTIVEVPITFFDTSFLDLNGQNVHKDDFPKLSEVLKGTIFDQGKYLILVEPVYLLKTLSSNNMNVGVPSIGISKEIKLVIKAK